MLQLKGIIPPVFTPLQENFDVDLLGLERLIHHISSGGVHGLFILGTSGEGPSLSQTQQRKVIENTAQFNTKNLPILVSVTDSSPKESIALAHYAKEKGATALVLAPPYYFPVNEAALLNYFEWIIPQLGLPVMLYNIPSHTSIGISVAMAEKLSKLPQVIGIKESSGNMEAFNLLLHQIDRPGFSFFVGPEMLLGEVILSGGNGGVPGGANLYPKLFVAIYEAALANDLSKLQELQNIVRTLYQKVYDLGSYGTGFMKGMKTALAVKGLCESFMMPPNQHYGAEGTEQIKLALESIEQQFPFLRTNS